MKEMNQKMGTHKFRFSDIMPHSWLYKLKGISRSSRKHFPSSPKHLSSPEASSSRKLRDTLRLSSSPVHHPQASSSSPSKSPFKRRIKRKTLYKPSSRVKLSPNPHGSLTSSRNQRSKSSSANAIILEPSDSTARVTYPSDQLYGSPCDPEPHCSIDIKDDHSVRRLHDVSQEPSASKNSSPVLVEAVKGSSSEMRTQRKIKKPNAGSSILANSSPVLVETMQEPSSEIRTQQKMKTSNADSSILANSSPVLVDHVKEPSLQMITQQKLKKPNAGSSVLASSSPVMVDTVKEPQPFEMGTQQKLKKSNADASILVSSSPVLVETVKEPPPEMVTQQKLKRPNSGSSGIRIRENSPKIARKKAKGRTSPESKEKRIAKSFAIVLTSVDPERDFKESMVEMIVENKIKEQKDLEDLLACYLSLNSSEYHDIIIKAFEKTWFHLTHLT